MLVQSFLVQGATAASAVASKMGTLLNPPSTLDGLVLMSLGIDHEELIGAVLEDNNNNNNNNNNEISCPIFVTETYGIIGYDDTMQQNIELMEKGRGSEYGFRGGTGGQGCLVIGYSDGAVLGSNDDPFPSDTSSLMVIADQSGSWKNDVSSMESTTAGVPLHYGGITKTAWKLQYDENGTGGKLVQVPYFWVADSTTPIGVSTFTGEAGSATNSLLTKLPSGYKLSGSVGLFPCFSRGVNEYDEEHVEPTAITAVINKSSATSSSSSANTTPRIYGMMAHGELGPIDFAGFTTTKSSSNNECIPCTQHSGSSILSIHTLPN